MNLIKKSIFQIWEWVKYYFISINSKFFFKLKMIIEKEDVDEIVDLLFNEKEVNKEVFEVIHKQELSEYFQTQILRKVKRLNQDYEIKPFDITLRVISTKSKIKKKKKFSLGTGGYLFGSHPFCSFQSKELPPFGFILIPLVHKELFEKKVVLIPMGSKYPIQNIGQYPTDDNLTKFLTNSLYCKDIYIILTKIHD